MLLQWMWEGFLDGVMKVVELWWLVLLFIAIQVMRDAGWLAQVSRWMRPILRPLGLPDDAGLPVAAGLAVGVTYGSGIILQAGEEGKLSRAELTVTCVFVGICHAVIEETILLAAAGTSGALLVAVRALAGFLFAYGSSWVLLKKA